LTWNPTYSDMLIIGYGLCKILGGIWSIHEIFKIIKLNEYKVLLRYLRSIIVIRILWFILKVRFYRLIVYHQNRKIFLLNHFSSFQLSVSDILFVLD
jgi:hypothetical protein